MVSKRFSSSHHCLAKNNWTMKRAKVRKIVSAESILRSLRMRKLTLPLQLTVSKSLVPSNRATLWWVLIFKLNKGIYALANNRITTCFLWATTILWPAQTLKNPTAIVNQAIPLIDVPTTVKRKYLRSNREKRYMSRTSFLLVAKS